MARYVIARVYGLTNEVQKRFTTKSIDDEVVSLMTVTRSVYDLTSEVQNRHMSMCIGDLIYFLMSGFVVLGGCS